TNTDRQFTGPKFIQGSVLKLNHDSISGGVGSVTGAALVLCFCWPSSVWQYWYCPKPWLVLRKCRWYRSQVLLLVWFTLAYNHIVCAGLRVQAGR
ncbi:MAG: hypothetical protein VX234_13510, partial [Pseudomonadota bacterium]|nr:hypothetical protein [Pseudomonadota bacterium]